MHDTSKPHMITAQEMAKEAGVDPKLFRAELRDSRFHWHQHNDRWEVVYGSSEHNEMKAVLDQIVARQS
ncbi:hypothetical protein [Microvirga sp. Mcv34]|uniref:hypothetical protein n=1 Tax=Microvirga sp. Mcv34 TaxID=2926016 RepID=UPI0021C90B61|nr:hypothetical protein [Microvirga sp. Mcv34]